MLGFGPHPSPPTRGSADWVPPRYQRPCRQSDASNLGGLVATRNGGSPFGRSAHRLMLLPTWASTPSSASFWGSFLGPRPWISPVSRSSHARRSVHRDGASDDAISPWLERQRQAMGKRLSANECRYPDSLGIEKRTHSTTRILGLVHRLVGVAQQGVGVAQIGDSVTPMLAATATEVSGSMAQGAATPSNRRSRSCRHLIRTPQIPQQQQELVTAEARDRILRAHAAGEPFGDHDQQSIASRVTMGVIDGLEAIQIQIADRQQTLVARRAPGRCAGGPSARPDWAGRSANRSAPVVSGGAAAP